MQHIWEKRDWDHSFTHSPFCNGLHVWRIFMEHWFHMPVGNLLPSFVVLLKQCLFDLTTEFETKLVCEVMSYADRHFNGVYFQEICYIQLNIRFFNHCIIRILGSHQSIFRVNFPDDIGSKDFWNASKLIPGYIVLQLRRWSSSMCNCI